MDLTALFFYITLAVVLIVVIVLVFFLLGIILALARANKSLYQLTAGLGAIEKDTKPLTDKMTTINGALGKLLDTLRAVDGHLVGIARIFGR